VKKISILILALVVALGSLGVGYAMWSDDIVIEGTVNTGTVDINIIGLSGTEVYKDLDTGGMAVSRWAARAAYGWEKLYDWAYDDPPTNGLLVAWASSALTLDLTDPQAPVVVDDSITMDYFNLFPGASYCADFVVRYVGSIPVHVYAEISTTDAWLQWLWDNDFVSISYLTWDDIVIPSGDIQLHEGDTIKIVLCVTIPQEFDPDGEGPLPAYNTNDPAVGQDLSGQIGSFTALIKVYQWNEVYP